MNIDRFVYKKLPKNKEFSNNASNSETCEFATLSCNFDYRGSFRLRSEKMREILRVLRDAEYPMSPKEIAFRTSLKHGTVKSYLRRMVKLGLVVQVARGLYSCKKNLRGLGLLVVGLLGFIICVCG